LGGSLELVLFLPIGFCWGLPIKTIIQSFSVQGLFFSRKIKISLKNLKDACIKKKLNH